MFATRQTFVHLQVIIIFFFISSSVHSKASSKTESPNSPPPPSSFNMITHSLSSLTSSLLSRISMYGQTSSRIDYIPVTSSLYVHTSSLKPHTLSPQAISTDDIISFSSTSLDAADFKPTPLPTRTPTPTPSRSIGSTVVPQEINNQPWGPVDEGNLTNESDPNVNSVVSTNISQVTVNILTVTNVCEELSIWKEAYEIKKGASILLTCLPSIDLLYHKMQMEFEKNNTHTRYDGFIFASRWINEFAGNFQSIGKYLQSDKEFNYFDIFPFYSKYNMKYRGDLAVVPLDGHIFSLFYREDILLAHDHPVPRTWDEYIETISYFDGLDFNDDGVPDLTSCIPNNDRRELYFFTILAPYMQTNGTEQGIFFELPAFLPLVNNEAFEKALKIYKAIVHPRIETYEDSVQEFIDGKCLFMIDSLDLAKKIFQHSAKNDFYFDWSENDENPPPPQPSPSEVGTDFYEYPFFDSTPSATSTTSPTPTPSASRTPSNSRTPSPSPSITETFQKPPFDIINRVLITFTPGSHEYLNRKTGRLVYSEYINHAPFSPGTSWSGSINKHTSDSLKKLVVYDFLSFCSKSKQSSYSSLIMDQLAPFRISHFGVNPYWQILYNANTNYSRFYQSVETSFYEIIDHSNAVIDIYVDRSEDYISSLNAVLESYIQNEISEKLSMVYVFNNWTHTTNLVGRDNQVDNYRDALNIFYELNSSSQDDPPLEYISIPLALILLIFAFCCFILFILFLATSVKLREKIKESKDDKTKVNWNIDIDELQLLEIIGSGSIGDVYRGIYRGTEVAIKKLRNTYNVEFIDNFIKEIAIMSELRHPNVLLFMGSCNSNNESGQYIITEYMPRGSLYDILHDSSIILDWELIKTMALDAIKGLEFLHSSSPPVLHGDFKSLNLLVDNKWNLKVADFGLSKLKKNGNQMLFTKTSIAWTAPEVLQGDVYSEKADVYSFSIVLWELMTRSLPYIDINQLHLALAIIDGKRPIISNTWSNELIQLLNDCWNPEANARPTCKQIRKRIEAMDLPCSSMLLQVNNNHIYSVTSGGRGIDLESGKSTSSSSLSSLFNSSMDIQPPNGCITFLFTDIFGYMNLWEIDGKLMKKSIQLHNKLLKQIIIEYNGYLVKSDSDSFMIAFQTTEAAINSAMNFQERLLNVPWPKKLLENKEMKETRNEDGNLIFRGFRVRIGINTGEAKETIDMLSGRTDYFGKQVNIAAQLTSLTNPGDILITENSYSKIQKLSEVHHPDITEVPLTLQDNEDNKLKIYRVSPSTLNARFNYFQMKSKKSGSKINHDNENGRENTLRNNQIENQWIINYEEIQILEKLGEGTFGEVYRGKWRGGDVAVKRLFTKNPAEKILFELKKESLIMSNLRHPNILLFLGSCINPPNLCIVTEYMKLGSLASLLHDQSFNVTFQQKIQFAKQAALGMNYLHHSNPPLIHRDLTSHNLLVCFFLKFFIFLTVKPATPILYF